jgi:transglutaminase-like putative cysteine protease
MRRVPRGEQHRCCINPHGFTAICGAFHWARMGLHSWFEAYVGGRRHTFDATQGKLSVGGFAVGYGQDAADVAVYNRFGPVAYATA